MQLKPNTLLADVPVQRVFIGSCTNSRIEDLRAAAAIAKGRKVAEGVVALVVPGSGHVKHQAEEEGLDRIFLEAGFEWRDAGCSMCMSMNDDKAMNGERIASTSNRNFEGRQGKNAKTHLMGPAMAAAAAVTGRLATCAARLNAVRPVCVRVREDSAYGRRFTWKNSPVDRGRGAAADPQSRHRQDLSGDLSEDDQAHRAVAVAVPGNPLSPRRVGEPGFRAQPGALPQCQDPDRRREFRLRVEPRARAVGACSISASAASSRRALPTSFTIIASRTASCRSRLPKEIVEELMEDAKKGANAVMTIDLETQTISRPDGEKVHFELDAFRKHCLLNGLDDIGLTEQKDCRNRAYEEKARLARPWQFGMTRRGA